MSCRLQTIFGAALLVALIFSGCTAQKKLARLIKKHPELVRDSVLIDYDTTIFHVEAVRSDSVVHINTILHDTFYIQNDRLMVKTYVYNDSFYIEAECSEIIDTVFSVERIPYKYIVSVSKPLEWWKWMLIGFIVYLVYKEYRTWAQIRAKNIKKDE